MLLAEVERWLSAPGSRVENLRAAYAAIERYAAPRGLGEEWCDRVLLRLLDPPWR